MSLWSRLTNVISRDRLSREIDEEMQSHIAEAIEQGRDPAEARRAFGSVLQHREQSGDIRVAVWLDSLRADVVFGWRQLMKKKVTSAAAILSLALATGAATAAFRLVDAVLLRTLPVAQPDRLFFLATTNNVDRDGRLDSRDDFDYPTFRQYRQTVQDRADLMVVGMSYRQDVTFGSGEETEQVYRQFVSGNLFGVFGIQPALGRLLTSNDDLKPGAEAVAVLSYDFWTRRFGRDPKALGKTFRMGNDQYQIVGVAPKGFIGTEPGVVTDVFIPSMMNSQAINSPGWSWFRIWVRPKEGVTSEQVRQPLQASLTLEHQERVKSFHSDTPKQTIDSYLSQAVILLPAAAGASRLQKEYRRPLLILAVLVALVLLIACANVGNLLTAQAAARAREMALRVSIGAGQWRLFQLVLVESALLGIIASAAGTLLAWWSAPLVVAMLAPPQNPVRLILDTDWRIFVFSVALTISITILFGLAPALRASSVKPISALKGGDDPHSRRRLMNALLAAQMAFCVLVQFVAGLFVGTFERLSTRPLGFSHQRVLILQTGLRGKKQPLTTWMQVADHLRQTPGVESVSLSGWALLTGNRWTGTVLVPGRAVEARSPYFLDVSPGFFETMRIALIDGRDFRPGDAPPRLTELAQPLAGVGIVNEAFARTYFAGQNPLGRSVDVRQSKDLAAPMQIVGYVRDASYGSVREPIRPIVYVPIVDRNAGTFLVRTAGDPLALASILRRDVSQARSEFRVGNVETQSALVQGHMIRERLLATLSLFFALVALVLAGIGMYGVLNYSVIQRRREVGIRMALGARSVHVVRRVTADLFEMVCLGSVIGLAGGLASGRFVETLLFEVKPVSLESALPPILALLAAALLAVLHPAIRAVRIDPAQTLRSE
jgi:putative ABC transport system permease protein